MPILEFQHVNKVYNNSTKALDDVSFSVEKGEFVSIIGPSGAGKSTILRCINRLIDATDGNIIYDGDDILTSESKLNMMKFPVAGSAQTYDSTSFCPDSASTATSISTGTRTRTRSISC